MSFWLLASSYSFFQPVLTLQPLFSCCSCILQKQAFSALSGRFLFITSSILSQRVTVHCLSDAILHRFYYCVFIDRNVVSVSFLLTCIDGTWVMVSEGAAFVVAA